MQVNLVIDESVDFNIIKSISNHFKNVIAISKVYPGIKDKEVIRIASETNSIIITEDKDFGEWAFAHNIKDLSVILLRYEIQNRGAIILNTINLIRKYNKELFGKFVVIKKDKIRIRDI